MTQNTKRFRWVWLIVVAIPVVVLSTLMLNREKDMSGGYRVIYQIDCRGLEPSQVVERTGETVEVLKRRVDPKHVLGLIWIPRSNACFEVQIPLPGKSVKRKYEAYAQAEARLETQGISPDTARWCRMAGDFPEEIEKDPVKRAAVRQYLAALDRYIPYLGIYNPASNRFDPDPIKRKITQTGYLDFRILPTPEHTDLSMSEVEHYIEQLQAKGPREAPDTQLVWCEIGNQSQWYENREFIASYEGRHYVLASNAPDECMLHGPQADWKIERVAKVVDDMGRPAVHMTLNDEGGARLAALTENNIDRPLCILLDHVALSAPRIRDRISKDVMIMGLFTSEDSERVFDYLNAGCLSASIVETPIAEGLIGNETGRERSEDPNRPVSGVSAVMILKDDVKLTRLNVRDRIRQTGQDREIALLTTATVRGLDTVFARTPDGGNAHHQYEITVTQEGRTLPKTLVEEIVSAILATFAEELDIPPDLEATIVSTETVTDASVDRYPELSGFVGGIRIRCHLAQAATGRELIDRFESLRFSADVSAYDSPHYEVLGVDLQPLEPDVPVQSFAYLTEAPESSAQAPGAEEWARLKRQEIQKISIATGRGSLPQVVQFEGPRIR